MRTVAELLGILALLLLLVFGVSRAFARFGRSGPANAVTTGEAQLRRVVDDSLGVVCYIQNYSVRPPMACVKVR